MIATNPGTCADCGEEVEVRIWAWRVIDGVRHDRYICEDCADVSTEIDLELSVMREMLEVNPHPFATARVEDFE